MTGEPMTEHLDAALVPEAVLGVLRGLLDAGHEAWLVGGGVRDLLRTEQSRPPEDWDVATSARPRAVMNLFKRVVPTGIKHGTVTVLTRSGPVEVTTFRGEAEYSDARRPDSVRFLDRVEEDLARRDFTMNAIAWNPFSGEVRDPFGGIGDLRAGVVRAVRDPVERFTEDGLRPMRAVRLACVLGLRVEEATRDAIPRSLPSFRKVAVERVKQELEKMMQAERPSAGMELMRSTGLLSEVLPDLDLEEEATWSAALRAVDQPASVEVRMAALFAVCLSGDGAPKEAAMHMERLRFPRAASALVRDLVSLRGWEEVVSRGPAEARRILARLGLEHAGSLASFWRALGEAAGREALRQKAESAAAIVEEEAAERPPLRPKDLALSGEDVMRELGVGPGPVVGRAMAHLLDLVIENPALNEPARLREALSSWKPNGEA